MNLTVPSEHLFVQPDGTLWFVVKGEPTSSCGFVPTADTCVYKDCLGVCVRTGPTDGLVALAAPCETCHGTRQGRLLVDFGNGGPVPPCPDCADRTLTIETECDVCEAQTMKSCPLVNCDGHGTVSLGPFRIETPVPIVGCVGAFAEFDQFEPRPAVLYHPNPYGVPAKYLSADGSLSTIDLGPNPEQFVGWYAVKAVTEAS